ncbi:MAG: hypothetical protein MN733_20175 [Nitrososphaera sp.]|nr:hypothetical protein [Nitrososphaera sp.]
MKVLKLLLTILFLFVSIGAQNLVIQDQDGKAIQLSTIIQTPLAAYTKWRDESLRNFPQGLLTPHYAVAIVAQRLDDHTAQVEMLIAADMKHYTITIRPVTLVRQPNGETTTTPVGNAVTINQKAGRKLNPGPDAIRIGDTTTLAPVTRAAQALEITWAPKNDKPDDPSNTCIVRLGKEPEVVVNGYIVGAPVR